MRTTFLITGVVSTLLVGCVNVVTDASTNSVSNTQTNVNQVVNASSNAPHQGSTFDIEAVLGAMEDRDFATGYTDASGVWIISKVQVAIKKDRNAEQAAELAAIRAQKNIAGFLGTAVSSSSELTHVKIVSDGKTDVQKQFKRMTKTKIDQFMRGVTCYKSSVEDNTYKAIFYATGRMADRTLELQKQLRETPPGVVRAVGFGVIVDGRIPKAKQQAVQVALRNAVEQVMGSTVIGQSQLMDNENAKSKMISQTVGSVKQYRIVKEGQEGINYQVILNAEVDEQSLLDNYAEMVRSMGNPPFIIQTQDPDLKTALTDFFVGLGFMVTEDSNAAQFIVKADCKYLPVTDDYYGKGIQIDVGLTLFNAKTKQQLISLRNSPQLTSTYSGSFHQVRQSAAKKAFKTMKKDLHGKLNKLVMDWILNGRDVEVVIKNMPADGNYEKKITEAMGFVPCAKLITKFRQGDSLVLKCSYVGASSDFEDLLMERLKKELGPMGKCPHSTKIDLNSIELSF